MLSKKEVSMPISPADVLSVPDHVRASAEVNRQPPPSEIAATCLVSKWISSPGVAFS